ncbi:hypothetical protein AMC82_CH02711 [Rhizobium phaseoli]|nr:hypothetical protein AMC84_CH02723 [Rhizobium phaseoli]ANL79158.1 hypothetical protein AMC82_CH02711 [Rhizobium phaseoli]
MRFRLFYEGDLLSSGNNSKRPAHKHDIRRAFHKQLQELWRVDGNLNDWVDRADDNAVPKFQGIADRYSKWGYRWVPLVNDANFTHCSIDILMLRPGRVGGLIVETDIDNRLKTLFNAWGDGRGYSVRGRGEEVCAVGFAPASAGHKAAAQSSANGPVTAASCPFQASSSRLRQPFSG